MPTPPHSTWVLNHNQMREIKYIEPTSWAKVYGFILACFGLVFAALMALVGMGSSLAGGGIFMGGGFGIAYLVIAPIIYGLIGFVLGLISAMIYNFAAGRIGGVRIQLDEDHSDEL